MSNNGNNNSSNNNNNNEDDDDSKHPCLLLPGETGHCFVNYDKLNPPEDWNPTPAIFFIERLRLECELEIQYRQFCGAPELPSQFFIIKEKEEINCQKRACEEHWAKRRRMEIYYNVPQGCKVTDKQRQSYRDNDERMEDALLNAAMLHRLFNSNNEKDDNDDSLIGET